MSERILVAGGAGFIGKHLCRALVAQGHRVFCLDNFSTSDPMARHELEDIGVHVDEADVTMAIDRPYDAIYHLASPASPVHYRRMALSTMWANALGTKRLVELANASGGRFLLASTSEIYGDPLVHPQTEDYWGNVNPIGERACYDESKRFAETLTWEYRRVYNVNARIVRIFNTYGPGMMLDDGRAIPEFTVSALKGRPIRIQGSGEQTRSFCYVDDLVRGLLLVGQDPKADGQVYNLGSPGEFTVSELANLVKEISGSSSEIVYGDAVPDDPKRRKPNIDRIKAAYNWEPTTVLRDGLAPTIADIASRLDTAS
ncbi:MAG TPA: NAD-dependent epimerase/dehydratase family protein [Thermomicrobiales bacterium]|nr:NAD-dependent epimerase/dehydratase family protein [Thermomicrobiales bacterium]